MSSGMGIDEFLSHQPNQSGGGKVLRWTNRNPPMLRFWLHTEAFIDPLWRHGWPRLVELDKDGERESHIWSGHFHCWEDDKVVSQQYKRTREGGREQPPKVCPMCLFLEHLRFKVEHGDIDWLDPIFEFDAPDDETATILYAAAMYNGIPRELGDDEKEEMKAAGIRRSDSWKQNTMAKCSYVLTGVDDESVSDGIQIIIENTLTGDKLRTEIRKQIKRAGPTKGNPLKTPYPFLLEYMKEEREIQKKYDVTALDVDDDGVPGDVTELIKGTEPPSIAGICKPGDVALLRSVMEDHIVDDMKDVFDWDHIFGPSEKMSDEDSDEAENDAPPPKKSKARAGKASNAGRGSSKKSTKATTKATKPSGGTGTPAQDGETARPKRRRKKPEPEPEPEGPTPYDGDDGLECELDGCGFMMGPDWAKCPECGTEYSIDDDEDDDEASAPGDNGQEEPEPESDPKPAPKKKPKAPSKSKRSAGKARGSATR